MKRTLILTLLFFTLALSLNAKGQMTVQDFEREVWRLTNVERSKYGLAPLHYDEGLAALAKRHCVNMLQQNFFAHRDPWGDEVAGRKNKYYPELIITSIGENLGKFTNSQRTFAPHECVTGWMNSPQHRANILDSGYTHLGVGIVLNGTEMYATQNFAAPIVKLHSQIPDKLSTKNIYRLSFEYMSGQDPRNISCTLIFPDPNATYQISDKQEMVGAMPLKINWNNKGTFEVDVPFRAGKGDYKLCFGFDGGYFPEGIALRAK